MAKLIFSGEKFGGRTYELAAEKTTVGRGDHNTLAIHDPSVSQTHCEIHVYRSEVIVRDLGSSNGTFVNGERLHNQQRPVRSGQSVKFGSVEACLQLDAPPPDDTATADTAIFSHVRYMREQQRESKRPAARLARFDSGSATDLAEQTVVLPRPPLSKEVPVPAVSAKPRDAWKRRRRIAIALFLSAIVVGLMVVVLLILLR